MINRNEAENFDGEGYSLIGLESEEVKKIEKNNDRFKTTSIVCIYNSSKKTQHPLKYCGFSKIKHFYLINQFKGITQISY
ncbi:hypothetical protein GCM10011506_46520 [Marivirga lumbricoides]|uniref:Uncharacterized protein n=1 Tax=Marivirga lumbricoides TaxID=1046115 RepID=A0ABQ1N772_9BACT|nr:hypothetical protein GCM10011506_46520 [Marivirga lumbricoides]